MKRLLYLLIFCILLQVVSASPSYHVYGNDRFFYNESIGDYQVLGTIDDTGFFQFYDFSSNLIVDVQLSKLNTYINETTNETYTLTELFDEDDNLSIILSENPSNVKWGYSFNLGGKAPTACTSDNDCKNKWACVNSRCLKTCNKGNFCVNGTIQKPNTTRMAFRMFINSSKDINAIDNHIFEIPPYYFDYNDIINESFSVNETIDNNLIILDIYREWNMTYGLVTIDPYFGESTPSSPPASGGGGGGSAPSTNFDAFGVRPPENLDRSHMDCTEWEYWDMETEKCLVTPTPPEDALKPPYWAIILLLVILYRRQIAIWMR